MKALLEAALASGDLTKANVASLATSLEGVDYMGILPERSYSGDPAANVVRSSWIVQADSTAADGLTPIVEDFTSPLVEEYPFEGPCFVG